MNALSPGLDVLLVGYEEEENLGIRSIAAFLNENGIKTDVESYRESEDTKILERILKDDPDIVGFSLIFQRMLPKFADLISFLRQQGVESHFTIGGHFPTLDYKATLEFIPELDTVIRHEGEKTLLELYNHIKTPEMWPEINGIAWKDGEQIKVTPSRPLIGDLDSLPFILRNDNFPTHRGIGISFMLASRGCNYNCSFCSIHSFYKGAPGPKRRMRSSVNVVQEIDQLFKRGVKIFSFRDDDLGGKSHSHRSWLKQFAYELKKTGLNDKILWRISCRVDEVETELLTELKAAGLNFLYLGIESGHDDGLRKFNKHCTIDDVYQTLEVLRNVDMEYDYGFMIFEPETTFNSIKKDIDFLYEMGKDGRTAIHFTKMIPYVGTQIFLKLKKEGRLKGSIDSPDYGYKDRRIELLETFFSKTFYNMFFEPEGLVNKLQDFKIDSMILKRFFPEKYDDEIYSKSIRELTKRCNDSILNIMYKAFNFMEEREYEDILYYWDVLEILAQKELQIQIRINDELDKLEPLKY